MQGQSNENVQTSKVQRTLRKRMTDAERALWEVLRYRQMAGHKFRRQHPFEEYVLDFVCLEKHLVIEADGSQHLDQAAYDEERTRKLQFAGLRVLRFTNMEVLRDVEAVKERIWLALQE